MAPASTMVTSRQSAPRSRRHRASVEVTRHVVALVMLLTVAASGCSADEAVPPGGARTFYEALDLSTPTAAAETFLDAFARDDFMTVWLILHPTTHFRLREDLQGLQHGVVVDRDAMPPDVLEEVVTSTSL